MEKKPYDIDRCLLENVLPLGFIKDRFITTNNKPTNYSYEDYLRELLNASPWFMSKTNGESFTKPASEAHSENDAQSATYSIDFKLILGQSIQYVNSKTSSRIDTNENSSRVSYRLVKSHEKYQAFWLHRVLRQLSIVELQEILAGKQEHQAKDDIIAFINTLKKDKNLLLFYPVILEYSGEYQCNASHLCEVILGDYGPCLELRSEEYPLRDTYIAFIYENKLQIALYRQSELLLVDSVDVNKSSTFKWIADFYWMEPNIKRLLKL